MLEKIDLWFSCFPVDNKRIDGLCHELHQLQRRGFVKIDVFFFFLFSAFICTDQGTGRSIAGSLCILVSCVFMYVLFHEILTCHDR